MKNDIKLFESKKVRTHWDEKEEKWYFSIIDVIEILSGSPRPRKYWNALKTKLQQEGSELSHKLGQLKMEAGDETHGDEIKVKTKEGKGSTFTIQILFN